MAGAADSLRAGFNRTVNGDGKAMGSVLFAVGTAGVPLGNAVEGFAPRAFKAGEDLIHFEKHGSEIANQLRIDNYSVAQYVDDANWVIQNGKFSPELNAYVSIPGGSGAAKGLMVGVNRMTGEITTMHLKPVTFFEQKAPSLGWQAQPKSVVTDTIGPQSNLGWKWPY
jgi:hypothetical protein